MKNNTADRTIHLVDMIWAVCQKWRQILAWGVVFAIMAGGFSYYKSTIAIKNAAAAAKTTAADLEVNLSEDSMRNVTLYLQYLRQYDDLMQYSEKSPLMKLDSSAVYEGVISYSIEQEQSVSDNRESIVAAYKSLLESKEFIAQVAEIAGYAEEDSAYAAEMVLCEDKFGYTVVTEKEGMSSFANTNGIITVCTYAENDEQSAALSELVKKTIDEGNLSIAEKFGAHKLALIDDTWKETVDSKLLRYQQDRVYKLATYAKGVQEVRDKLTSEEKQYVEYYQKEQKETEADQMQSPEQNTNAAVQKAAISKKLTVVGAVLGIILAVGVYVLFYLFDKKIRLEDAFENNYEIPLLGNVLVEKNGKKKWFFFIDNFFVKMRHWNKHYFAEKEAVDMVAAGIRISAKRLDAKKVFVTGSCMGEKEQKVFDKLAKTLKGSEIEIVKGKPVLYDAEALEKSAEIGFVVFMECAGVALHKEILEEIENSKRQGIEVIGAVVIA